jgi:hypothetical protein
MQPPKPTGSYSPVIHVPNGEDPFEKIIPPHLTNHIFSFADPISQRVLSHVCRKFKRLFLSKRSIGNEVNDTAEIGSIPLLRFLNTQWKIPFTLFTCMHAAYGNQLETLQWLRRVQGCPWDDRTTLEAVRRGNLQLLIWAVENGCPTNIDRVFHEASQEGHLEIVKWIFIKYDRIHLSHVVTWAATYGGHLHILQWLIANGFRLSSMDANVAAEHGDLKVLKWVLANGAPYDHHQLLVAAQKQPAVLQWLNTGV